MDMSMMLTFKRLAALSKDSFLILSALEKSPNKVWSKNISSKSDQEWLEPVNNVVERLTIVWSISIERSSVC